MPLCDQAPGPSTGAKSPVGCFHSGCNYYTDLPLRKEQIRVCSFVSAASLPGLVGA